jgi:predicted acyl esterase
MTSQWPEPKIIMRVGQPPSESQFPAPPPVYRKSEEDDLLIERNVAVPLATGATMYVDLYRPAGAAAELGLPIILAWSPYGKHRTSDKFRYAGSGVEDGWMSKHTGFEAPDPAYWCKAGYAVAYADPPGMYYSQGEMHHGGPLETRDCCDLIAWLGQRPWSNGRVGMSGVSYLACIQWQVAAMHPPHLAAINPWEGFSDWYREFGYHGGLRDTSFVPRATSFINFSTTRTEDTNANMMAHPLYDEYWASKDVDLAAITVPAYVVASWSDHGLHTRGTLEAYKALSSHHKWLDVHGRKKWGNYYDPRNVAKLREFFDHFLKQSSRGLGHWPKVRIEVREEAYKSAFRDENEWPLARTRFTALYLDAKSGKLLAAPAPAEGAVAYDPRDKASAATFDHTFTAPTELTGHIKLRLWIEIDAGDDADLFVALQKLDAKGEVVPFCWYALYDNGPVALGWLRASHRATDPARSRPEQPFHTHTSEEKLTPGEPVAVDIEVWASSTAFAAGETLRVVVKGSDIYDTVVPGLPMLLHEETRNAGTHTIRTGGRYDSHLLVPVIPPAGER